MARGPSRRTAVRMNPQLLNTCVSRGARSTTELSATPRNGKIERERTERGRMES